MAECIKESKPKEFWKHVKNINNGKNSLKSNCVDDCTEPKQISDFFAKKYENLFNKTKYSKKE